MTHGKDIVHAIMKIVEAVHAGGCGFESRPPRSSENTPIRVCFTLRSGGEKHCFEKDEKRLSISHGAKRVRYETCTVPVGEESPVRRAVQENRLNAGFLVLA